MSVSVDSSAKGSGDVIEIPGPVLVVDKDTAALVLTLTHDFSEEARAAAVLFQQDQLRGCGELLAALNRFVRQLPVDYGVGGDPTGPIIAMIGAIRDTCYGHMPELFQPRFPAGTKRPLSTANWASRGFVYSAVEALRQHCGLTIGEACREIAAYAKSKRIDLLSLAGNYRSNASKTSANTVERWHEELAKTLSDPGRNPAVPEVVIAIMVQQPPSEVLASADVKAAILERMAWLLRARLGVRGLPPI